MTNKDYTFEELVRKEKPFWVLIIAPQGNRETSRKRLAKFFETYGAEWKLRNERSGITHLLNSRTGADIELMPEELCKNDNYLRGHHYDLIVMDWTTLVMGYQEGYSARLFQIADEIRLFSEVIKEKCLCAAAPIEEETEGNFHLTC